MRQDVENEITKIKKDEVKLLNKSELARRLGCNRRTVDKYINQATDKNHVRKKREYSSKLDDYISVVIEKVDTYGATAMAVYKFIQKKGYSGGYGTVNNFVKKHKKDETKKATIRFETTPGLQAQVDWKEQITMINRQGEAFTVNIFLMVLGYSRLKFIKLTTDKAQKTLFMCMFEAIKYYQGVPHEILFDNMATVVDRDKSNFKSVSINQTFKHFSQDAGFTPVTCRPYRAQTKGKVESLAKFVDRLKVYNGEFDTYEDIEKITNEFMEEINLEISQATAERPFDLFEKEKEYLNPLPSMFSLLSYFSYHKEYKVSKESMVTYKGRKYSVSTKYIGYHVNVIENEHDINVYYMEDLIDCHPKSNKIFNYKQNHVTEILKADALKHFSDNEIEDFIMTNLKNMDILLK